MLHCCYTLGEKASQNQRPEMKCAVSPWERHLPQISLRFQTLGGDGTRRVAREECHGPVGEAACCAARV